MSQSNLSQSNTSAGRGTWSITKWNTLWFALSGTLFVGSIVACLTFGLKFGIDFTGGSLMQISYPAGQHQASVGAAQTITQQVAAVGVENAQVQPAGDESYIIKTRFLNDDERQAVLASLGTDVKEDSFESIGPTIGAELRQKSIYAVLLVVIGIVLYVAFVFRKVSKGPVPSWTFGLSAIVALIHDIVITTGVFAVFGALFGAEVNVMFITALLTILGFSVNDTIVVFDRIREVLRRSKAATFAEVIDESVRNTMMRSLNTTTTAAIVLLALLLFGSESIRFFVATLLAGIIIGTYSSVCIASPSLLLWQRLLRR